MHVIICGGGIIGAATALFLARRGVRTTVVERTGVAAAASGKSGGFLARDWCDGTPVEQLARRSFALHAELAAEGFSPWGYRGLTTYAGTADFMRIAARPAPAIDKPARWMSPEVQITQTIGLPVDTAQVHPGALTDALMRAAVHAGATLLAGEVTRVSHSAGALESVEVDGQPMACDKAVLAMGPWTNLVEGAPVAPVFGVKGHSLVFQTGGDIPPEALFLQCRDQTGAILSPEIFPRADGTTYVCAISSEPPLPAHAAAVEPDPAASAQLERLCAALSPHLTPEWIIARQACFRPMAADGLPLIGKVPGVADVFVATGHGVWGILNGPATGEAMACLLVDGHSGAVDLAPFDPARLSA
ncbi:FAD-dependent oxidoreductase [Acuticoccus sp. MNP-M23]|uniref:NAD(P)/FAD-dependent oxidoreductase n=1 Tax=Acuticoccus sp. MNP-M23 TaxID=3072793 RepID=UPI002815C048|nr:FAD-dependent oxidoreductase [Acuticoccus sp. MNP-M23]WMS42552.1 FAD-dependent oxidoreductase [Acuticoccus sp. MNP-M23]